MFREMRRKNQILSLEETEEILRNNTAGVLSVLGDEGYPYGVPLSYVYHNGKIYFHSATSGHKMDAVKETAKVSFCVIDQDQIVGEELTTYFRSAIAFGEAKILEHGDEFNEALMTLGKKYAPELSEERIRQESVESTKPVAVVGIDIHHITGKEAIELRKMKGKA